MCPDDCQEDPRDGWCESIRHRVRALEMAFAAFSQCLVVDYHDLDRLLCFQRYLTCEVHFVTVFRRLYVLEMFFGHSASMFSDFSSTSYPADLLLGPANSDLDFDDDYDYGNDSVENRRVLNHAESADASVWPFLEVAESTLIAKKVQEQ